MARKQNPQRQPSSLERLQQRFLDTGFRQGKKLKEKKPETRVAEFKLNQWQGVVFDEWVDEDDLPYPKPGQIIPWGRRSGTPFKFEGGRIVAIGGTSSDRYRFAMDTLGKKHNVIIEVEEGFGDYVSFRTRGLKMNYQFRLANTQIASVHGIDELMGIIEKGLRLNELPKYEGNPGLKALQEADKQINSPVETWAEKWARENS